MVTASLPREREIDGLRSIAIVPVLLYHTGWSWMPGGFVGVDIFFVISGDLITRLLVGDIRAERFSLWSFYERRARRIMPALLLVIACTTMAAMLIMVPPDLSLYARSLVWTILFASNIYFSFNTGYFAAPAESYPLLHTWSLALEEQFYLLFPLLLWGLARLITLRWTMWIVAVLALLSLALSIVASPPQPTLSFYLPLTRSWELWLGSLLAFGAVPKLRFRWLREILAAGSLALIGWTIFALPPGAPFPGWIALLPTLGAVGLIRFSPGTWIGRGLSSPPLVGIGLISYSLYLWHWPLLALGAYWAMRPLTAWEGSALVALAIPLSIFSWWAVERPFRNRRFLSRSVILGLTIAAMFVVTLGATGIMLSGGLPQRLPAEAARIAAFANDISPRRDDCHELNRPIPPDQACVLGAPGVAPSMAVWADSHGVELSYALGEMLAKSGQSVVEFTSSACSPSLHYSPPYRQNCAQHNQDVFTYLLSHSAIKTVVVAALVQNDDPIELTQILPGLDQAMSALRQAGRTVVILYPVPSVSGIVPARLAREFWRDGRFDAASYPLATYQERLKGTLAALDAMVASRRLVAVRPTDLYCPDNACVTYRDGIVLYFDFHHPTLSAARLLAGMILDALAAP